VGASGAATLASTLTAGELDGGVADVSVPLVLAGTYTTARSVTRWLDTLGGSYGPVPGTYDVFVEVPPALTASVGGGLSVDADDNGVVTPGDTLRYTLTVQNTGSVTVSGIVITTPLDANTRSVAASAATTSGFVLSETDAAVVASVGTLSAFGTATLTWDVSIVDPLPSDVATVSAHGTVSSDDLVDVSTATFTTPVATDTPVLAAFLHDELRIDADGDGGPSAGDTIRYLVQIENPGLVAADGVVFALTPAIGSALVAGTVETDGGTVVTGNGADDIEVRLELDALDGQSTVELTFEVVAHGGGGTVLSAQGTVSATDVDTFGTDDPATETPDDATLTPLGGVVGGADAAAVSVTSPVDGERIGAPVDVLASASPVGTAVVSSWRVLVYAGGDEDGSTVLASGTGDLPATLTTFDPTLLENGLWTLRVEVTDDLGRIGVGEADVVVAGDMKLGAYDVAFVDAEWHSSVTEISLLRSYSTLRKDTVGDFGHGWRLSMLDMRVQRNGPLGDGGWRQEACGSGFIYHPVCTVTDDPHVVVVRWPDGGVEVFDVAPDTGSSYFSMVMTVSYTGRPGTTSTLTAADGATAVFFGDDLATTLAGNDLYDPRQYWLTDRAGTMYLLDIDEGLLETVDRNGNRTVYGDDGIVPDRGIGVDFVRDSSGRIARIDLANGSSIDYDYDAAGDLVSVTDQLGDVAEFTYDAHRLTAYNDAGHDPIAVLTYDADGRLVEQVDPTSVYTSSTHDLLAWSETITRGRLAVTTAFDADGQVASIREDADGEQRTTTWEYDDAHQVVRTVTPEGGTSTFAYDDAGNLLQDVDPDGILVEHTYDGQGRRTSTSVGGENKGSFVYDAAGNLLAHYDGDGTQLRSYSYDDWGGLDTWQTEEGQVGSLSYDGAGQVNGFVVDGAVVQFNLDSLGIAVGLTDAGGTSGAAELDERGELVSFTDANGHAERWDYDERGMLIERTDKAARASTYTYIDDGRPLAETTRKGEVITYTYDDEGRLARVEAADAWVAYAYDGFGRRITVENAEQTVEYTYDLDDNVLSETTSGSGYTEATQAYAWSAGGRLLESSSDRGVLTWAYDDQGRPVALTDSHTGTASFEWGTSDLVARIERARGLDTTFEYGATGLIETIRDEAEGALIEEQEYERDAGGRVLARTDASGTHDFDYDERGRLVGATHPSTSGLADELYAYDANGNRHTSSVNGPTVLAADPLTQDDASSYAYDAEGRLDRRVDRSTGDATTYEWDAFGQLRGIHHPSGEETTFAYDGLGRRVSMVHDGVMTQFVHDGEEVRYTLSAGTMTGWLSTSFDGRLLAAWDPSTGLVRDAVANNLGSRTAWVTGGVREDLTLDSFGYGDAPEGLEPHAFSWHALDPTGLVFARSRYYDPATGRFLSEDPLEAANRYTYAENEPLDRWDPDGMSVAGEYGTVMTRSGLRTIAGATSIGIAVTCMISFAGTSVGSLARIFITEGPSPVTFYEEGNCKGRFESQCFLAGTAIATPEGPVAIETLEPGDVVIARGTGDGGDWVFPSAQPQAQIRDFGELGVGLHQPGWLHPIGPVVDGLSVTTDERALADRVLAGGDEPAAALPGAGSLVLLLGEDTRHQLVDRLEDGDAFAFGGHVFEARRGVNDRIVVRDTGSVLARVGGTFVHETRAIVDAEILYEDGRTEVVNATGNHPFYVPSEEAFLDLDDVEVGTELETGDGRPAVLTRKTYRNGDFEVYNFSVTSFHNYFVGSSAPLGGVLVHNACTWTCKVRAHIAKHGVPGNESSFGDWAYGSGKSEKEACDVAKNVAQGSRNAGSHTRHADNAKCKCSKGGMP
jgi:RHS repeat-associated protein/uncharacterized repeat protein (TIGR01451 family)